MVLGAPLACALAACAPPALSSRAASTPRAGATRAAAAPAAGEAGASPAGWAAARGITGRYSGTWRAVESTVSTGGQAELVVLDRGLIRGTMRTGMRGVEGELVGQLRPQGHFVGACRVPSIGATLRLEGDVRFDPAGTAAASLHVRYGEEEVGVVDATLARQ